MKISKSSASEQYKNAKENKIVQFEIDETFEAWSFSEAATLVLVKQLNDLMPMYFSSHSIIKAHDAWAKEQVKFNRNWIFGD